MITQKQIEFKKRFEQQKCKVHAQSAELVISERGTYDKINNVCCKDFEEVLMNMVTNQIADETIGKIGF